jgi:hypothetical protein
VRQQLAVPVLHLAKGDCIAGDADPPDERQQGEGGEGVEAAQRAPVDDDRMRAARLDSFHLALQRCRFRDAPGPSGREHDGPVVLAAPTERWSASLMT